MARAMVDPAPQQRPVEATLLAEIRDAGPLAGLACHHAGYSAVISPTSVVHRDKVDSVGVDDGPV
jgi:hypothetical protein